MSKVTQITDTAKNSKKIILATDPDREGEAIAWHVKEYLKEKKLLNDKHVERVVFNEITKKAVLNGIENPREIEPIINKDWLSPALIIKVNAASIVMPEIALAPLISGV